MIDIWWHSCFLTSTKSIRVIAPHSCFAFLSHYIHCWEKAMATHSSILAWKIPWMEEPGRLQSMGSLRVRHDWVTSLSLSTVMHWRRKWQPTPVFLPGESHGRRSVVGCSPWGRTESDTTEATLRWHIHCWWDYQWLSASTKAWYGDWNQIISIWFHLSRDF